MASSSSSSSLGNFLFGNVDEDGNLDDDFLDKELKEALSHAFDNPSVEQLLFKSTSITLEREDVILVEQRDQSTTKKGAKGKGKERDSTIVPAADAVDFSNIDEAVNDAGDVIKAPRSTTVTTTDEPDFISAMRASSQPKPQQLQRQDSFEPSYLPAYTRPKPLTPSNPDIFFPQVNVDECLKFSELFVPQYSRGWPLPAKKSVPKTCT